LIELLDKSDTLCIFRRDDQTFVWAKLEIIGSKVLGSKSNVKYIFLFILGFSYCISTNAQSTIVDFTQYFPIDWNRHWVYKCIDTEGNQALTQTSTQAPAVTGADVVFTEDDRNCSRTSIIDVVIRVATYSMLRNSGFEQDSTEFSPPLIILPMTGTIGQSYSSSGDIVYTDETGSYPGTYSSSFTPEAQEAVVTPAGIFEDTIRVAGTVTTTFKVGDLTVTYKSNIVRWYARGIGTVRYDRDGTLSGGKPYNISMSLLCSSILGPCAKDDGEKDCDDGCTMAGDPIHIATGNSMQVESDYEFPRSELTIRRLYNSRYAYPTKLGTNWRHAYDHRLEFAPSSVPRRALLQRADGKIVTFTEDTSIVIGGQSAWKTEDGDVREKLFVDATTVIGGITTPSQWRYVLASGDSEMYNIDGQMTKLATARGQNLVFTYETRSSISPARSEIVLVKVTDSFGRILRFNYDTSLRIRSVDDGSTDFVSYTYDASSRLTRATYRDTKYRGYGYNESGHVPAGSSFPYALTTLKDENQAVHATWDFDAAGRAYVSQLAGNANRVDLSYLTSGTTLVTDSLNTLRTINFSRVQGAAKVTSFSSPGVPTLRMRDAARAYDANANVVVRDDFNGNRSCANFDLTRNLQSVRLEGFSSGTACPVDLSTYVIPGTLPADKPQRKVSMIWHPQWRLEFRRAEPKLITTSVYNGQPDPTTSQTVTCAPVTAKLPDDSPIAVLCRRIEQPTKDATGSNGFSAASDGPARIWNYTYNGFGQKLTEDGPRTDVADVTTWVYYPDTSTVAGAEHTLGDLKSMTDALGRKTQYSRYDKAGRLLKTVQPNGVLTDITYTPRGWVDTVTLTPNGSSAVQLTDYDYWPTGLLKKATQPDASWLSYTYDDAHRLTDVADNLGNTVHYTLDNMGNRKQEDYKDPAGALAKTLARTYDALNRLQNLTGAAQ
jgi:YD repeat-containing protein